MDCFRCFDKTIGVTYPDALSGTIEYTRFWVKRFCPCVELVDYFDYPTLSIFCVEDTDIRYSCSSNVIHLFGPWNNYSSWLGKFISQCFQFLLIDSRIIFLPAASLFNADASLLVIGDFWQGKTSLSLSLMNLGFNLISDNYSAINDAFVLGGTHFLSVRRSMSYMVPKEFSIVTEENDRLFYERSISEVHPKTISLLVSPIFCEGAINVRALDHQEALWYIYGKATRLINGEPLLFGGELASPSFNNQQRASILLSICRKLLDGKSIYVISGKPKDIALHIKKMFHGDY